MFAKRKSEPAEQDSNVAVDMLPPPEEMGTTLDKTVDLPPQPMSSPALEPQPEVDAPLSSPSGSAIENNDVELARLRDILFGGQARQTDKRMADLELRVETMRQELTELIERKTDAVANSASSKLISTQTDLADRLTKQVNDQNTRVRTLHQELSDQIEQQGANLAGQIRANRRELTERIETQQTDQSSELRQLQKDLTGRIDELSTDFMNQLRQIHKELSERLDKLDETQNEQVRTLQIESKQRDDELHQELASLAAMLETKKVTRGDLGNLLMEMGQRLRVNSD